MPRTAPSLSRMRIAKPSRQRTLAALPLSNAAPALRGQDFSASSGSSLQYGFRPRPASPPASHQRCRPFGCAGFPPLGAVPGPPGPGRTPYWRRRLRNPTGTRHPAPECVRPTTGIPLLAEQSAARQRNTHRHHALLGQPRIIDYQPGGWAAGQPFGLLRQHGPKRRVVPRGASDEVPLPPQQIG